MPSVARSRSASARTTIPFLPPSSRLTRLSRSRPASASRRPVSVLPVKLMTGTSGLATIASPTSAPGPVTRLTAPGREAGLGHQLDQERGAVGRVARRLEHDRVAADERRHHLPARNRHREVPGRDDPGDPDRLADRHRPLVGQLRGRRVAEQAAALAGHQEGDVDALLDVAPGLGQDLAHLAGHRPGEALLVLGHEGPEAIQDLAALGRRRSAPAQRRPSRRPGSPAPHRPPCLPGNGRRCPACRPGCGSRRFGR